MALSCSTEKVRPPAPALDVAAGAGEVAERAEAHVERAGHPVYGCPLGLWVDVGVDVRGHRRARVPQAARRGPHVAPARYHHGGEGVPEVVERAAKAVHPAEGREVLAEPSWVAGQVPSPRVPGVQGSPRATPVSCATRSASRRLAEGVVSRCLVSAYPSALMSHIQEDTPSAERPARRTFRVQGSIWRAPAVATPSAARAGRLLSGSCWDSRCSRRPSRRARRTDCARAFCHLVRGGRDARRSP